MVLGSGTLATSGDNPARFGVVHALHVHPGRGASDNQPRVQILARKKKRRCRVNRRKFGKVALSTRKRVEAAGPWGLTSLASASPSDRMYLPEEQLTAIRVSHAIVGLVDGAIAQLPFGLNVRWYAGRDFGPYGLTLGVVSEQRRGCPYRREVFDKTICGSVVVRLAFSVGVCDTKAR